jgi:hypothetical protein
VVSWLVHLVSRFKCRVVEVDNVPHSGSCYICDRVSFTTRRCLHYRGADGCDLEIGGGESASVVSTVQHGTT